MPTGAARNWHKKYAVHNFLREGDVLLEQNLEDNDGFLPSLEETHHVIYYKHLFEALYVVHSNDHPKAKTFHNKVNQKYCNIPRTICDLFTATCSRCIKKLHCYKPSAGYQPIITHGFGAQGQIDLVDFQGLPDGEFKFLLNYYDHGIKFRYSTALVSKQAAAIAQVLLNIFSIFGLPAILQSDNGCEFTEIATNMKVNISNEVSICN